MSGILSVSLFLSVSLPQIPNYDLFVQVACSSLQCGFCKGSDDCPLILSVQDVALVLENWMHYSENVSTSFLQAPPPSFLVPVGFSRVQQGSCCWLAGWGLVSMQLQSVKAARRGRWTHAVAEVGSGGGDEVARIADWQLSSITCPASQMQVDMEGHSGQDADSHTVYCGCLFAKQSLVHCCLSLIHPPIYQSITVRGSRLDRACSISQPCYLAGTVLHQYLQSNNTMVNGSTS